MTTNSENAQLICPGDYPDPSILRVGKKFYITHSSFCYHPGLLIQESVDLVNWTPVTHAVDHKGWDIWAPELIQHGERFFIYYYAQNTSDRTKSDNFVIYADNLEGPWSKPSHLNCGWIDPGHIADDDGNRFLHLSKGHFVQLSKDGLSVIVHPQKCYDGWRFDREHWNVESFGLESPKLFRRGNWYYLISAQGGTAGPATSHMVVAARAKTPQGPWQNAPNNPIIHTESRKEKWWSRGHATLFEDKNAQWWAVYHAYLKGFHTLGRQTLIEPIKWNDDGWPEQSTKAELTKNLPSTGLSDIYSHLDWLRFDQFDPKRFRQEGKSVCLEASGSPQKPSEPLLLMPKSKSYIYTAQVCIENIKDNSSAGLTLFYNQSCFCGVMIDTKGYMWLGREGHWVRTVEKLPKVSTYHLQIVNNHHEVSFYYGTKSNELTKLWTTLETSGYQHNVFGKFLSLRPGIVAFGSGESTFQNVSLSTQP